MKSFLWKFIACIIFPSISVAQLVDVKCDATKWQFSKLDIEINDKDYLEMVMGFSYGKEVISFIPKLKVAQSNMYYIDSKAKPLITFFRAEFKDRKDADKASKHLAAKWLSNKHNQYDVHQKGHLVVWYGNNRLEPECFTKVVEDEKKKIL